MKKTTVKIKEIAKSPSIRLDAKFWLEKNEREAIQKIMNDLFIIEKKGEYFFGISDKRKIAEIKSSDHFFEVELFFPTDIYTESIDNFDRKYDAEKFIAEQWDQFIQFINNPIL